MQYTFVGLYDDAGGEQSRVDWLEADSLEEALATAKRIALDQDTTIIALFEGSHQDRWPV